MGKSSRDSSRIFRGGGVQGLENPTWGSSWALLGQLEGKLDYLGRILECLEIFLVIRRPSWASKSAPGRQLGAPRVDFRRFFVDFGRFFVDF